MSFKLHKRVIGSCCFMLSISLTGCASLGVANPPQVNDITIEKVFNLSKNDMKNTASIKHLNVYGSVEHMAFSMIGQSAVGPQETIEKQKILGALMIKASDDACYEYLTEISTVEKSAKSVLGSASILLSGAAGLATPVRSANLLSGISAATQGIEEELGSTILGGLDADILVQAVRKGRGRQRKALTNIINSKDENAGFNMFIAEFSTYHDSCGISYGRDVLRDALSKTTTDEKPSSGEVRTFSPVEG